jgi:protein-S-isoprenylcysteine O-methyltransferase Ste14
MTDDSLFRLILLGLFAAILPVGMYHRIRSNSGEKLDRRQEGAWILYGLRLSAVPGSVGGIAWLIDPRWMAWSAVSLPLWMRWVGVALYVPWAVLIVATFHTLGKNITDTVVTRKEHTLVTNGPYRYVRHPFYLAFAISVVAGGLVTANWFLFVAGCVPFGFILARLPIEEAKLIERFDDYRDYMHRVNRFVPRLRVNENGVSR